MKFTRKQIVFLISYPFVHFAISGVFFFMMLATGLGPGDGNWRPTRFQEIVSAVGAFGIKVFWAPLFLWKHLGLTVSYQTLGEYFSIFICGVFYAFAGVLIYKKLYQR